MDHARPADSSLPLGSVRRRLHLVRTADRFQRHAVYAAAAVLAAAIGAPYFGFAVAPAVGGAALAAVLVVAAARARPSPRTAAAQADEILASGERISTALALADGRAADPLGFRPAIEREARRDAGRLTGGAVRRALPIRPRRRSALTLLFVAALFFAPGLLAPDPAAVAAEPPEVRREKEETVEQLRRLERKLAGVEVEARDRRLGELEKLAVELQKEVARLAEENPRRAKAIARTAELARRTADEARRFAGLPRAEAREDRPITDQELADLAEAIRNLLATDPKAALKEFSALAQRVAEQGLDADTAGKMAELAKSASALSQALAQLAAAQRAAAGQEGGEGGEGSESEGEKGESGRSLGGQPSLTPEQMERMAKALDRLRQAIESGSPETLSKLAQEMRNYQDLQPSEQDVEQMLQSLEELARMIEAGEALSGAVGQLGGGMRLPGLGGRPGAPGGGAPPGGQGQGKGQGQGGFQPGDTSQEGDGMGGPGRGRGGSANLSGPERDFRPELDPSLLAEEGTATLFRTVRRVPTAEENPTEHEILTREANREAEEAIRRGEIPRRYREYVRRFFGTAEER